MNATDPDGRQTLPRFFDFGGEDGANATITARNNLVNNGGAPMSASTLEANIMQQIGGVGLASVDASMNALANVALGALAVAEPGPGGETALVAGTIRRVNPTRGAQNCVNCALATDATLAGRAASALPGQPTSISVLEAEFGGTFSGAMSANGISDAMASAGAGARGIVFGSRGSGQTGHVFNVKNQGGTVRFLDGQTGKQASTAGFDSLHLLRTN